MAQFDPVHFSGHQYSKFDGPEHRGAAQDHPERHAPGMTRLVPHSEDACQAFLFERFKPVAFIKSTRRLVLQMDTCVNAPDAQLV
jgi:hypothetical protein